MQCHTVLRGIRWFRGGQDCPDALADNFRSSRESKDPERTSAGEWTLKPVAMTTELPIQRDACGKIAFSTPYWCGFPSHAIAGSPYNPDATASSLYCTRPPSRGRTPNRSATARRPRGLGALAEVLHSDCTAPSSAFVTVGTGTKNHY